MRQSSAQDLKQAAFSSARMSLSPPFDMAVINLTLRFQLFTLCVQQLTTAKRMQVMIWLPNVRRLPFPTLNLGRGARFFKAGKEGCNE